MTVKTNALRLLESLGIAHRVIEYEVDEADLSAPAVAAKIGLPAEQVFKTLVLRGESSGVFFCCLPGEAELDLKKAARVSANRKVEMLSLKELEPTTGYVRGGCSPLCAKKRFPLFMDETAELFDEISVSAGRRGIQMLLSPTELIRAARHNGGTVELADIV